MNSYKYFLYLLIITIGLSNNTCPIILIHGFLGWGRDEMANYYYWGGKQDYETQLNQLGYEVYSVSVGPISANWERAIEAFYQIKGGQLDYGTMRSDTLGIIQKPINKNYSGLYPSWDENNPIHIIGHSQGGQTAKMLEVLLKNVFKNEDSPLLSESHNGWIKSITTISTPHNGSTLVPIMLDIFPFTLSLAPWFGIIENETINKLYNFDLDHWGLTKNPNETLNEFINKISNSNAVKPNNLCTWELTPTGAKFFNLEYTESSNVYYFSFTTYATKQKKDSFQHEPDAALSLHLWPTALLMGGYDLYENNSWYENDGVVNSISMSHPHNSNVISLTTKPQKGIWQSVSKLNIDHQGVIGHAVTQKEHNDIFVLYKEHCKLLYTLK